MVTPPYSSDTLLIIASFYEKIVTKALEKHDKKKLTSPLNEKLTFDLVGKIARDFIASPLNDLH